MSEQERCKQCGGILHLDYTITFTQCLPTLMRVEPTLPASSRLCPGHPSWTDSVDWDRLSAEQQIDVHILRASISDFLIAQSEAFYQEHPELRLTWNFTMDALIRAEHPMEDL